MRLGEISAERYAREVLPLTAPLWAGRRSFDEYVAQTAALASSPYGRRHYRTMGLCDGRNALLASFKRYERTVRDGTARLPAVGFGAVFTPPQYRGRGYASVMLAMALDDARARGAEIAYLFSDIHPQFYAALGFGALASHHFALHADTLAATRLEIARLCDDDWNGVRHVFELCERRRDAAFLRSRTVWDWIALRMRQGSEHRIGREANLVMRRRRAIVAYVFGVRAPERDAYVLDEFAYADEEAARAVPALLRAAAGDLRRITGWVPPRGSREILPRTSARRRSGATLMMAALGSAGERLLARLGSARYGEFCRPTDHI